MGGDEKTAQYFPESENELREKGILYKESERLQQNMNRKGLSPALKHMVGIDKSYGSTVMTPEYIRANWNAFGFKVEAIVEGVVDNRQDLIVLHKPS